MKRYNFSTKTLRFPDMSRNEIMNEAAFGPMTESASGEWVLYSDHLAELANLNSALENTVEGKLAKVVKMLEEKK